MSTTQYLNGIERICYEITIADLKWIKHVASEYSPEVTVSTVQGLINQYEKKIKDLEDETK